MLKREIKYEDFDGNPASDVFYFNLSKPELVELEVEYDQGFGKMLEKIIAAKNNKELITQFKRIVLLSYGEKSEDGKRFVKSDQLREEFSQTAAYQSLFMELATDDNAAIIFLKGVLPRDMVSQIDEEAKVTQLPVPPAPPTT